MKRLLLLISLLIPATALAAVIFSDDFNRANTSGTMEDASGKQWKDGTANMEISGNHVQCKITQACNAVGALVSNESTSQADVVVSALMLSGADQTTAGVSCRNRGSASGSRNFWRTLFESTTNGYRINKYVGGTQTVVSVDGAASRLASARVQILCSGSDFTVYENGVSVKTANDTALPTGFPGIYDENLGTAGLQMLDNYGVCDAVAECDDFSRTGEAAAAVENRIPAVLGNPAIF